MFNIQVIFISRVGEPVQIECLGTIQRDYIPQIGARLSVPLDWGRKVNSWNPSVTFKIDDIEYDVEHPEYIRLFVKELD